MARRELAGELLARANSRRRLGEPVDSVGLAAVVLREYRGRGATQAAYARDLADWLVWLEGRRVGAFEARGATVQRYLGEPLATGGTPAPATVARRMVCLSAYYRRAVASGLMGANPVEPAARPRLSETGGSVGISLQAAQELVQAARAATPRDRLLVLLLLGLGLRVSEAIGADLEDLGRRSGRRTLRVKSSRGETVVPLHGELRQLVEEVTRGRSSGPLLVTSTGRRLTRQHAAKIIRRLGRQIGLPKLHPHALRHTFITLSLAGGASLLDVQDAARHADVRTTRRYARQRGRLDRHPSYRLLKTLGP